MVAHRLLLTGLWAGLLSCLLMFTGCGKPTLASLDIEPGSATLVVGQTQQFTAIARDTKGNAMPEVAVVWSVDGASGRIDTQGLLRAEQPGTVTVTAAVEEIRGTVIVTVQRQPVARLVAVVSPTEVTAGQPSGVTLTVQNAAAEAIAEVEVQAQPLSAATTVQPQRGITDTAGQVQFTVTTATQVSPSPH